MAKPEQRRSDTRSYEVKVLDQQFPPAKPEDFFISYGPPDQAPPMTKELKQFDQSARTRLSGAQFDRALGYSLITIKTKVAQHTKPRTPEQLDTYGYSEYAKLEKAYGASLTTGCVLRVAWSRRWTKCSQG